jgi:spermidine/putrescine ABC transporter ATP-binding subunit
MQPAVSFARVSRHFGAVRAVDDVSFEVGDGEFFAMLGPSGSGKTTCLRLIAGFEEPDGGAIALHGSSVLGVPPYDRHVNTVFQDYALFPHMNVLDNVAYGLMVRGVARAERYRRAEEMLALVALGGLGGRRPAALSGGQRQRVALARALINQPEVLLLDEPLGALDLKLRQQMQSELKALQRKVGITFLYVTHDQEEALTMSDRLAVMNGGQIEQIGAPRDVYEDPQTLFVADFLGVSNLMDANAKGERDGGCDVELDTFAFDARGGGTVVGPAKVVIRPERVELEPHGTAPGPNRMPGMVERIVYVGSGVQIIVRMATGEALQALQQNTGGQVHYEQGTPVQVHLPAEALRVLPAEQEREEPDENA